MAKKPSVTTISSGFASNTQLNTNFTAIRDAFDNTLSLDGSTPNAMGADLDLNNNDLLNASVVNTATLKVGGVNVVPSAATALAVKQEFDTVADLLASTLTYSSFAPDDYIRVVDGGYVYQVAASSASDQHVTTAGGVKLYANSGRSAMALLKTTGGTEAELASANAAIVQKAIDAGFSLLEVPAGLYPMGPLTVGANKSVVFDTVDGVSGTLSRRARFYAPAGQTADMISVTGAGSRLRVKFFELNGNRTNNGSATFAAIKAVALSASERGTIVLDNASIRDVPGNGLDIGNYRDSWEIKNHSIILNCGGFGVYSVGSEDIYFENSECGECDKTCVYIDGDSATSRLVSNIRLSNFDIYRGGLGDPGEAVANTTVGQYDNIHIGGWVGQSKLMFGESLGAYRHGISFGRSSASDLYAAHFVVGVRFTANSRQTTNRYSDIYARVGRISVIAPIFTPFETVPSQAKNLVEVTGELAAADYVMVSQPQWRAPGAGYAGSYGTARVSDNSKVQWFDDQFLFLNRNQYIRKAAGSTGEAFIDITGSGGQTQFSVASGGAMRWGDGTSANDILLFRAAANILELTTGDSFRALGGLGSSPLAAAPSSPWSGLVVLANGAGWDPLATGGAAGAYWVWWTGSTWRGLHETGNGTNLS
jgi:hypothetical protein